MLQDRINRYLHSLLTSARNSDTRDQAVVGTLRALSERAYRDFDLKSDFGAIGDGKSDDSAAIQSAIDSAHKRMRTWDSPISVIVPPGHYRVTRSLTMRSNVRLVAASWMPGTPIWSSPFGPVIQASELPSGSWLFDGEGDNLENVAIVGLHFHGGDAEGGRGGVRLPAGSACIIAHCCFYRFGNIAISLGTYERPAISCFAQQNLACWCGLHPATTTGLGPIGVLEVYGSDHYVLEGEYHAGRTEETLPSRTVASVAILDHSKGETSNCFVRDTIGEFADFGFLIEGSLHRLHGCRADTNAGHGFCIKATQSVLSGCTANRNGQARDRTYYDFFLPRDSDNIGENTLIGCQSVAMSYLGTNLIRCGFFDEVDDPARANTYVGCSATAHRSGATSKIRAFDGNGLIRTVQTSGPPRQLERNAATPDVTGCRELRTANQLPTSILTFSGGHEGQEIVLLANDENTTIVHDERRIMLKSAAPILMRRGTIVRLTMLEGVWREG